MPPKDADKLNLDQIGWIREWITKGAAWPNAARIQEISESNAATWSAEDGMRVQTRGGLSNEWTNRRYQPDGLWAYQAVNRNDTKGLSRDTGQTNLVDGFIAASMRRLVFNLRPTQMLVLSSVERHLILSDCLRRQMKSRRSREHFSVEQVRQLMQKRKVHPDLIPPRHAGFAPEDFGNERIVKKGIERLRWEFERYEPFALSVYNGGTPQAIP